MFVERQYVLMVRSSHGKSHFLNIDLYSVDEFEIDLEIVPRNRDQYIWFGLFIAEQQVTPQIILQLDSTLYGYLTEAKQVGEFESPPDTEMHCEFCSTAISESASGINMFTVESINPIRFEQKLGYSLSDVVPQKYVVGNELFQINGTLSRISVICGDCFSDFCAIVDTVSEEKSETILSFTV